MAYDEELAFRLRGALETVDGVMPKRMFGGMAFLKDGHLTIAASGQGGLMVRIDPADASGLVERDGVERMVMGGRQMDGWLRVSQEACSTEQALQAWVDRGLAFVGTLPPQ